MHKAIKRLTPVPEKLLIDGNRFKSYPGIPHQCIVKGDSKVGSIAAASILAKTYRDRYMERKHMIYPKYGWLTNKGYPTLEHRHAILHYGPTELHRRTFQLYPPPKQLALF